MEDQEEGQELHFDLINATFSPNKGVVCHIVASWNIDNISGAKAMLDNIDDIEVFECTGEDGQHEEDQEDDIVKQLTDEEKDEYIKTLNGINPDEKKGGGLKQNPPLVTTSSLVHFLSKAKAKAKQ